MDNHESVARCNTFNAILFEVRIMLRDVIHRHVRKYRQKGTFPTLRWANAGTRFFFSFSCGMASTLFVSNRRWSQSGLSYKSHQGLMDILDLILNLFTV